MPFVTLRKVRDVAGPDDITLVVKENTFDYLRTSGAEKVRVSAYLDRDWPMIDADYEELFIGDNSSVHYLVNHVTPGSRLRKDLVLPCAMNDGEQLVLEVERTE